MRTCTTNSLGVLATFPSRYSFPELIMGKNSLGMVRVPEIGGQSLKLKALNKGQDLYLGLIYKLD